TRSRGPIISGASSWSEKPARGTREILRRLGRVAARPEDASGDEPAMRDLLSCNHPQRAIGHSGAESGEGLAHHRVRERGAAGDSVIAPDGDERVDLLVAHRPHQIRLE